VNDGKIYSTNEILYLSIGIKKLNIIDLTARKPLLFQWIFIPQIISQISQCELTSSVIYWVPALVLLIPRNYM